MKLTEMQILQAIGQADEKTVNRTAPRQSGEETGRRPVRIRRRALEMIAVCAALCIFIGGGVLIRELYRAQNRITPVSDEETAARDVLEQFFAACKKSNQKKMRALSLLETVCGFLYEDDPQQAETTVQTYLDGLSRVSGYQIVSVRDDTDLLDSARIIENEQCEYYAYLFEDRGDHAAAEKMRGMTPAKDYYSRADRMYVFTVRCTVTDSEGQSLPEDEWDIPVVRYDGNWYVQLVEMTVPYMGEERRKELAEYRANDPDYHGDAAQTAPREEPRSADETPENKKAKTALTAFLEICRTGDADAIRENCMIGQLRELLTGGSQFRKLYSFGGEPAKDTEQELELLGSIFDYDFDYDYETAGHDAFGELDGMLTEAAAYTYYDAWRLEQEQKHDEAMARLSDDPLTFFLRDIDAMRSFVVKGHTYQDGVLHGFTETFYAAHYQGKWTVMPYLLMRNDMNEMSEEENAELHEFIRSVKNLQESDLSEYENTADWKTWNTTRTEKAEQHFSGGTVRAGLPVIALTEAKLPPAGGTALSLLIGPEQTGPYTVSFDFRMPEPTPGVLNFVTCCGANTVPDDEPYGEQRYWYKLQPNGMISYETSFGHGAEEIRSFYEKNAAEQCFDPKLWNTMTLKSSETGVEVYINGRFAASLPDPNGMRIDLTGRLALDGSEGIMLRNFVFEDAFY